MTRAPDTLFPRPDDLLKRKENMAACFHNIYFINKMKYKGFSPSSFFKFTVRSKTVIQGYADFLVKGQVLWA